MEGDVRSRVLAARRRAAEALADLTDQRRARRTRTLSATLMTTCSSLGPDVTLVDTSLLKSCTCMICCTGFCAVEQNDRIRCELVPPEWITSTPLSGYVCPRDPATHQICLACLIKCLKCTVLPNDGGVQSPHLVCPGCRAGPAAPVPHWLHQREQEPERRWLHARRRQFNTENPFAPTAAGTASGHVIPKVIEEAALQAAERLPLDTSELTPFADVRALRIALQEMRAQSLHTPPHHSALLVQCPAQQCGAIQVYRKHTAAVPLLDRCARCGTGLCTGCGQPVPVQAVLAATSTVSAAEADAAAPAPAPAPAAAAPAPAAAAAADGTVVDAAAATDVPLDEARRIVSHHHASCIKLAHRPAALTGAVAGRSLERALTTQQLELLLRALPYLDSPASTRQLAQLLNEVYMQMHHIPCPLCGVPVQHSSGCMHMTCSRCTGEFCYACGGVLAPNLNALQAVFKHGAHTRLVPQCVGAAGEPRMADLGQHFGMCGQLPPDFNPVAPDGSRSCPQHLKAESGWTVTILHKRRVQCVLKALQELLGEAVFERTLVELDEAARSSPSLVSASDIREVLTADVRPCEMFKLVLPSTSPELTAGRIRDNPSHPSSGVTLLEPLLEPAALPTGLPFWWTRRPAPAPPAPPAVPLPPLPPPPPAPRGPAVLDPSVLFDSIWGSFEGDAGFAEGFQWPGPL